MTNESVNKQRVRPLMPRGLSGKLLLLTLLFVMLAEVLIFVPSVSNFRRNWLLERLNAGQIAALAVQAAPRQQVPKLLRDELLKKARVHAVALRRDRRRWLVLEAEMPGMIDEKFDLSTAPVRELLADAIRVFFSPADRKIMVIGHPTISDGSLIEVVVDEKPLKAAMFRFAWNIAALSLVISGITAALVYFSLNALLVRPMRRLTRNMVRFSRNPEDARRIVRPSGRLDEIGTAETELASMQQQLSGTLNQKNHLAALGLAVSKINHDLRNILANAQLISDHLGTIEDPTVQRLTPRLINSLDRAIRLCSDTLSYGRANQVRLKLDRFAFLPLCDEIAGEFGLPSPNEIGWSCQCEEGLELQADRDQLFRVLGNLVRNARQALEDQRLREPTDKLDEIAITASNRDDGVEILIRDSGPGIPEKARSHLFEAFQGSTSRNGSGLGLAIAAEIVRAHGGTLQLRPDESGACFRLFLPQKTET